MNTLKQTFTNEAECYDKRTFVICNYEWALNKIVNSINMRKNEKFCVLDLGFGTGNLMERIRNKYPEAEIYGIEFSNDMFRITQEKNIKGAKLFCCDIFNCETKNIPSFDIVVSSFVFHNFVSAKQHYNIYRIINSLLTVNGKVIIADLFEPENQAVKTRFSNQYNQSLKSNNMSDSEVNETINLLNKEDKPLTIEKNLEIIRESGLEDACYYRKGPTAVFIAMKKFDIIQMKAELLIFGARKNKHSKDIYFYQNPRDIKKTGNNGIFLNIAEMQVLISINHERNKISPYELSFNRSENSYYIKKFGKPISVSIIPITVPGWYNKSIGKNKFFSDYFVFEGDKYLHLAYKCCSYSEEEMCQFCSTKRRRSGSVSNDPRLEDICEALDMVMDDIIKDDRRIHFCLGGGTYLPIEDNIKFFRVITKHIRQKDKHIPIWIETVPPDEKHIKTLVKAGATSFGFNLEIWDDEKRQSICPKKSADFPQKSYFEAFRFLSGSLNMKDKAGSCIIVGLDTIENIKVAIDILTIEGVHPCILALKLFDGVDYEISERYVRIERDFINLSKYAAEKIIVHGLNLGENEGCMNCTCCSIMHDLI